MGIPVVIYGKSGSGKSRSLKNFEEDEIFFINVEKKLLPFRKRFKYELKSDDPMLIMEQLSKMPTKVAVVDDTTFIMTNMFMRGHRNMKGNQQFELYNNIADGIWHMYEFVKNKLPDDVIVYFIHHEDSDDFGQTRIKTIGKLLDSKVCIEGIVTICIRCMSKDGKHYFKVDTDGSDLSKAPEEMFPVGEFENDLKLVDSTIREYYGMNEKKKEKEKK